jgi:hypothetical protein
MLFPCYQPIAAIDVKFGCMGIVGIHRFSHCEQVGTGAITTLLLGDMVDINFSMRTSEEQLLGQEGGEFETIGGGHRGQAVWPVGG